MPRNARFSNLITRFNLDLQRVVIPSARAGQAVAHLKASESKNIACNLASVVALSVVATMESLEPASAKPAITATQEHVLVQHIKRLSGEDFHLLRPCYATLQRDMLRLAEGGLVASSNAAWKRLSRSTGRTALDGKASYQVYLDQRRKDWRYDVKSNIYNIDEKGFIGWVAKQQRVFSKTAATSGALKGALQDGNREWITMLAGICADGTPLPPVLIYAGQQGQLQDTWVQDVDQTLHNCHFAASLSGWTNDAIALNYMEKLYEPATKAKAGTIKATAYTGRTEAISISASWSGAIATRSSL